MNVYSDLIKYIDKSVLRKTRPVVQHLLQIVETCPDTSNWQPVDCYLCGIFICGLTSLVFTCDTPDITNTTAIHRIYQFIKKHFQATYIIYSQSRHASFVEFVANGQHTVRIFANNHNLVAISNRVRQCVQQDWILRTHILSLLYVYRVASSIGITKRCVDDMQMIVLLLNYHVIYKINDKTDFYCMHLVNFLNRNTHEDCWYTLINTLHGINEHCRP